MSTPAATGPIYAIQAPGEDPRFCFGLIHEIATALESHGFPPVTGRDHVDLGQALFRFLYLPQQDHSAQEREGSSS